MPEYIERKEVLSYIDEMIKDLGSMQINNTLSILGLFALTRIKRRLEEEPPYDDVRPERYGKWKGEIRGLYHGIDLLKDEYFQGRTMYSCSECGEKVIFKGNFCPNCGAKMDGKEG